MAVWMPLLSKTGICSISKVIRDFTGESVRSKMRPTVALAR
jgi:hypothetical protein